MSMRLLIFQWMPRRPGLPLTVFFTTLVVIAELKLMLTYVYNFKGTSDLFHDILGMDDAR